MLTVAELVDDGESKFKEADLHYGHGTDNARDEAFAVLYHVTGWPVEEWYDADVLAQTLTLEQIQAAQELFQQRIVTRQPLPYLTGVAYFAGLAFKVDQRVIIPRSPIAELIEHEFQPWIGEHLVSRAADICTGSGCIAIAMAHHMPQLKIDAVDISQHAVAVAEENVIKHQVSEQVSIIQSDLFDKISQHSYDVIVSNPPYVPRDEVAQLPEEYSYEPDLALDGGETGFELVDKILRSASHQLTQHGLLILEVGHMVEEFETHYAGLDVIWLDFARGGAGVLLADAAVLRDYFKNK